MRGWGGSRSIFGSVFISLGDRGFLRHAFWCYRVAAIIALFISTFVSKLCAAAHWAMVIHKANALIRRLPINAGLWMIAKRLVTFLAKGLKILIFGKPRLGAIPDMVNV